MARYGGGSPLAQRQMFTLEALANRPAAELHRHIPAQGPPPEQNQQQQAEAIALFCGNWLMYNGASSDVK